MGENGWSGLQRCSLSSEQEELAELEQLSCGVVGRDMSGRLGIGRVGREMDGPGLEEMYPHRRGDGPPPPPFTLEKFFISPTAHFSYTIRSHMPWGRRILGPSH